jgi:hypothetical protein
VGFTIAFDIVNNRHPKTITIYPTNNEDMKKKYAVDDSIFTVWGLEQEDSYTLVFSDWSEPKQPLVITGIYVDIKIDINSRNMIALNRSISYRGDNKLPSYGIISNVGNLEFNDLDGEIKDYAEQLLLTSDLKVDIYLNNTLTKSSEKVGVFQTETWDYDNDNNIVNVSIGDSLEELQDNEHDGFSLDYDNISAKSISWIYDKLVASAPSKYRIQSSINLDAVTKNLMDNTRIGVPFLNAGNFWAQFNKLSTLCLLRMYKTKNGETTVKYHGGD